MRKLKDNLVFAGLISVLSTLTLYISTVTIFGINQAVNGYCENIFILAFNKVKGVTVIIVIMYLIIAIIMTIIPFINSQVKINVLLYEVLILLGIFFIVMFVVLVILLIYTNNLC